MKTIPYKKELLFLLTLVVVGQILFALMSPNFTKSHYESRIYATTGVSHDNSDLHKLNEAAHYFGQTIIGWTKFPNFLPDLIKSAGLPPETTINVRMQERQNMIYTVYTIEPIEKEKLIATKDFLQKKLDDYNQVNRTKFVLTNLDYEQQEISKNYSFGALTALLTSLIAGAGVLFIKKELG